MDYSICMFNLILQSAKIKVAQLEKELYWTRAERDLLKKVKELESQDLCHK